MTVSTTAFIRFFAAWISEVAESSPDTMSSPDTFWTSALTCSIKNHYDSLHRHCSTHKNEQKA